MAATLPDLTRVLVVDDERLIADTLVTILNLAGFSARATYGGEEAVEVAREFRPDVLIADYSMPPGINGFEAAARIKNMLPGLRVIMLSGQAIENEAAPYQLKGFNFLLLSKPMHPGDLLQTINSEQMEESIERLKVLNVDDVETHRYSISRVLSHAGFEVKEATTGNEALQRAIAERPELVLLDIHLPDIDGYEVCHRLKSNPDTAEITVVHITASDKRPEAVRESSRAGADLYLTYPVSPSRLIHRLRSLLQLKYLQKDERLPKDE